MSLTDYTYLNDLEKSVLFRFWGDSLEKVFDEEFYAFYRSDEWIVVVYRSWEGICVSCDLRSCYNKESQNPINFYISIERGISARKEKRIFAALNFLLANRKDGGTFWSALPNFDDLGQHVRDEFFKNKR